MALQNLTIDARRLWDSLMETARIGGTPKGGIRRLTLTDEDRRVRDWFKAACEALGCEVRVDSMGNMFAVRPGRDNTLPAIAMGSHLDTQPTGGKFDGVLGVLGGLEALRTLQQSGYETNAPVMLVNWTNEEGSRFAPAMVSSGVYAGAFDQDFAYSRTDREGKRFGDELAAIGYRGAEPVGSIRFGAMFELHIEQGPILEAEDRMIGIVTGVQGMRWYELTVHGQEAHTGATPMPMRKNALVGAARLVDRIDRLGLDNLPGAATVGLLEVRPNSRNVGPGEVFFSIDLRHPVESEIGRLEAEMMRFVPEIIDPLGLTYELTRIWHQPVVEFDPACIDCVRAGAERAGLSAREIVSGAGHDAAYVSRVVPTTMIFVPCLGGLSHNEAESTKPEECAAGAQVLLNAVLEYDRRVNG
ncbi:MAG: M20 family metallo-hydrolase [Hyphomicrobiaceae bacterium]